MIIKINSIRFFQIFSNYHDELSHDSPNPSRKEIQLHFHIIQQMYPNNFLIKPRVFRCCTIILRDTGTNRGNSYLLTPLPPLSKRFFAGNIYPVLSGFSTQFQ